MLCIFPFEFVV